MEIKRITDFMGCTYSERVIAQIAELICEAEIIEREACAKLCEEFTGETQSRFANGALCEAANAIRMRSNV